MPSAEVFYWFSNRFGDNGTFGVLEIISIFCHTAINFLYGKLAILSTLKCK